MARKKKRRPRQKMADTIKVPFMDREWDAVLIPINQSQEQFNEYILDDGTVLRRKYVVTQVARLKEVYDAKGNPIYVINSQLVNDLRCPDELKGPPSK